MRGLVALICVGVLASIGCSKNVEGGACDDSSDCQAGLACFRSICMSPKNRDQMLTSQSIGSSAPVERPAVIGGDRVRVRSTRGEELIFAACGPTERLVGGGCSGGDNCASESSCRYLRSYPHNYTADDTLGARWYCGGADGTMFAYALCQETVVGAAPAQPPADAGMPVPVDAGVPVTPAD